MKRRIITARITTDAKKLWSCSGMRSGINAPQKGKLPTSSGTAIQLLSPGETPSPFCNGKRAWKIAPEYLRKHRGLVGCMVCEHQVDLDD